MRQCICNPLNPKILYLSRVCNTLEQGSCRFLSVITARYGIKNLQPGLRPRRGEESNPANGGKYIEHFED